MIKIVIVESIYLVNLSGDNVANSVIVLLNLNFFKIIFYYLT